jgi:hypothetical protein
LEVGGAEQAPTDVTQLIGVISLIGDRLGDLPSPKTISSHIDDAIQTERHDDDRSCFRARDDSRKRNRTTQAPEASIRTDVPN